jgi:dihydroorotate dehydrogenase
VLAALQGTPLQRVYGAQRVDDAIELAGLTFPNRVGLAAGLDKNAKCIDGLGAMGFGFVEVGTVTPLAQSGNPKPRLFRLSKAQALINRMGFNNDGLDAFIANVKRSSWYRQRQSAGPSNLEKTPRLLLGLNIGKNAVTPIERAKEDYLICLDGVYPYADYVTINISSPNTKNLRSLQSDDALDDLLGAIALRRELLATQHGKSNAQGAVVPHRVPIFVKIAPDLDVTQVGAIATLLQRHGMDGVIATNTTLSRDAVKGLAHADEGGGLSGEPVLAMSNRIITQLRAALGQGFPIIGVGGIMSAKDALSKIRAGADVVQIYTGLIYHGPALVTQAANLIKIMVGLVPHCNRMTTQ